MRKIITALSALALLATPAVAAPDDIDFPPGTDPWQEFLYQMCKLGNQSACDQRDPNYVPKTPTTTTGG